MPARIGVEWIEHFSNARATGDFTGAQDLSTPYYIAEFLAWGLEDAGHQVAFRRREGWVEERHLREGALSEGSGGAGQDHLFADRVDLYLIATHGTYKDRVLSLLFDTEKDAWTGRSADWAFGNNCDLEWLLIFGCHSIDKDDVLAHHHLFKGLHLMCGAYGWMYDSWTVSEAGGDLADNLSAGMPVSEAWMDGVSDWFVENHPCVISVERQETWRNGKPDWGATTMRSDHLWGEGVTRADIPRPAQHWMACEWSDRGFWDYG